jgi:hypothetical protein
MVTQTAPAYAIAQLPLTGCVLLIDLAAWVVADWVAG